MTNLDSILKNRDITLSTKVCLVKAMVFLVVMYGCESWTTKKAEHRRIVAFELWCWRRLFRVPWTARRSNHSILKEIRPEYSLEGLMLKLKLHYFGHLMWRAELFEKTLMLGKIEDRRRRGRQRIRWLDASPTQWTWVWVNSRSWWWTGRPGMRWFMGSQRVGHNWATELNWTDELGMEFLGHMVILCLTSSVDTLHFYSRITLSSWSLTSGSRFIWSCGLTSGSQLTLRQDWFRDGYLTWDNPRNKNPGAFAGT